MRIIFLILALLVSLVIAIMAIINSEVVTLNYLFGQVNLTLSILILGSALAGVLVMVLFSVFRSIHNYMKSEGDRGYKKELKHRVKFLEEDKEKLENELGSQKKELKNAADKEYAHLEDEKKKLEEELKKEQKEHEDTAVKETDKTFMKK